MNAPSFQPKISGWHTLSPGAHRLVRSNWWLTPPRFSGAWKAWNGTLTWTVEIDDRARRELRRLDRQVQSRILAFLRDRIAGPESPRRLGRALTGPRTGLWRYRVGNYRLVCRIEDQQIIVLVLAVAHRKDAYR